MPEWWRTPGYKPSQIATRNWYKYLRSLRPPRYEGPDEEEPRRFSAEDMRRLVAGTYWDRQQPTWSQRIPHPMARYRYEPSQPEPERPRPETTPWEHYRAGPLPQSAYAYGLLRGGRPQTTWRPRSLVAPLPPARYRKMTQPQTQPQWQIRVPGLLPETGGERPRQVMPTPDVRLSRLPIEPPVARQEVPPAQQLQASPLPGQTVSMPLPQQKEEIPLPKEWPAPGQMPDRIVPQEERILGSLGRIAAIPFRAGAEMLGGVGKAFLEGAETARKAVRSAQETYARYPGMPGPVREALQNIQTSGGVALGAGQAILGSLNQPYEAAKKLAGGAAGTLIGVGQALQEGKSLAESMETVAASAEAGEQVIGPVFPTLLGKGIADMFNQARAKLSGVSVKPGLHLPSFVETLRKAGEMKAQGATHEEISAEVSDPWLEVAAGFVMDPLNVIGAGANVRRTAAFREVAEQFYRPLDTLDEIARTTDAVVKGKDIKQAETFLGAVAGTLAGGRTSSSMASAVFEETATNLQHVFGNSDPALFDETIRQFVRLASKDSEEVNSALRSLGAYGFGEFARSPAGQRLAGVLAAIYRDPDGKINTARLSQSLSHARNPEDKIKIMLGHLTNGLEEHYKVRYVSGGFRETGFIARNPLKRLIDGVSSAIVGYLWLGYNYPFAIRNMVSNKIHAAIDGVFSFEPTQKLYKAIQDAGIPIPPRAITGYGAAEAVAHTVVSGVTPPSFEDVIKAGFNIKERPALKMASTIEAIDSFRIWATVTKREYNFQLRKAMEELALDFVPEEYRGALTDQIYQAAFTGKITPLKQKLAAQMKPIHPWERIPTDLLDALNYDSPSTATLFASRLQQAKTSDEALAVVRELRNEVDEAVAKAEQEAAGLAKAEGVPETEIAGAPPATQLEAEAAAAAPSPAEAAGEAVTPTVTPRRGKGGRAKPKGKGVEKAEKAFELPPQLSQLLSESRAPRSARAMLPKTELALTDLRALMNIEAFQDVAELERLIRLYRVVRESARGMATAQLGFSVADPQVASRLQPLTERAFQLYRETYDKSDELFRRFEAGEIKMADVLDQRDQMWRQAQEEIRGMVADIAPLAETQDGRNVLIYFEAMTREVGDAVYSHFSASYVRRLLLEGKLSPQQYRKVVNTIWHGHAMRQLVIWQNAWEAMGNVRLRGPLYTVGANLVNSRPFLEEEIRRLARELAMMGADETPSDMLFSELTRVLPSHRLYTSISEMTDDDLLSAVSVLNERLAMRDITAKGASALPASLPEAKQAAEKLAQAANVMGSPPSSGQVVMDAIKDVTSPPSSQAAVTRQTMSRVGAVLDQIETFIRTQPTVPPSMPLDKAQRFQLMRVLADFNNAVVRARAVASKVGMAARDFALLNYTDRYLADMGMSYLMALHFWPTRSIYNWFRRIANNPAILSNYVRFRDAYKKATGKYPEETGSYVVLGPIGLYLASTLNPLYSMLNDYPDYMEDRSTLGKVIMELNDLGIGGVQPIWTMALAALLGSSGKKEEALSYLPTAGQVGRLTKSVTAVIKELTDTELLPAGGVELNPQYWTGRQAFQGISPAEVKGIAAALTFLYQRGEISWQDMWDAAASKQGPVWDKAVQMAGIRRAPGDIAAFFLGNVMRFRFSDELALQEASEELSALYAKRPEMDEKEFALAVQDFFNRNPYYGAYLLAKGQGQKSRTATVWHALSRVAPDENGDRAMKAAGLLNDKGEIDPLLKRFYQDPTMGQWTDGQIELFMAKIHTLLSMTEAMSPEDLAYIREMREKRKAIYETAKATWPNYEQLERKYWSLPKEKRAAFLAENKELSDAWNYITKAILKDPELSAYFARNEQVIQAARTQVYQEMEQEDPESYEIYKQLLQNEAQGGDTGEFIDNLPPNVRNRFLQWYGRLRSRLRMIETMEDQQVSYIPEPLVQTRLTSEAYQQGVRAPEASYKPWLLYYRPPGTADYETVKKLNTGRWPPLRYSQEMAAGTRTTAQYLPYYHYLRKDKNKFMDAMRDVMYALARKIDPNHEQKSTVLRSLRSKEEIDNFYKQDRQAGSPYLRASKALKRMSEVLDQIDDSYESGRGPDYVFRLLNRLSNAAGVALPPELQKPPDEDTLKVIMAVVEGQVPGVAQQATTPATKSAAAATTAPAAPAAGTQPLPGAEAPVSAAAGGLPLPAGTGLGITGAMAGLQPGQLPSFSQLSAAAVEAALNHINYKDAAWWYLNGGSETNIKTSLRNMIPDILDQVLPGTRELNEQFKQLTSDELKARFVEAHPELRERWNLQTAAYDFLDNNPLAFDQGAGYLRAYVAAMFGVESRVMALLKNFEPSRYGGRVYGGPARPPGHGGGSWRDQLRVDQSMASLFSLDTMAQLRNYALGRGPISDAAMAELRAYGVTNPQVLVRAAFKRQQRNTRLLSAISNALLQALVAYILNGTPLPPGAMEELQALTARFPDANVTDPDTWAYLILTRASAALPAGYSGASSRSGRGAAAGTTSWRI